MGVRAGSGRKFVGKECMGMPPPAAHAPVRCPGL